MKTKIIIILGILVITSVFGSLFPSFAFAKSNIEIDSINKEVSVGQKFRVNISVSPKDETVYTSKISVSYPSDLIEVSSFSFAPKWLELSQPGYDLIDPTQGIVIKTAGFPTGIELGNTKIFGTITFRAKSTGNASIKITPDTQIYGEDNTNVFSGILYETNVAIGQAIINTGLDNSSTTDSIANATTSTTTLDLNQSASANLIGNIINIKTLFIILMILIIGIIGYRFYRKS